MVILEALSVAVNMMVPEDNTPWLPVAVAVNPNGVPTVTDVEFAERATTEGAFCTVC